MAGRVVASSAMMVRGRPTSVRSNAATIRWATAKMATAAPSFMTAHLAPAGACKVVLVAMVAARLSSRRLAATTTTTCCRRPCAMRRVGSSSGDAHTLLLLLLFLSRSRRACFSSGSAWLAEARLRTCRPEGVPSLGSTRCPLQFLLYELVPHAVYHLALTQSILWTEKAQKPSTM